MSRHTGSGKDKDNTFSAVAAAEGEEEQEKTSVGRRRRRNDESGAGNEEKGARCFTNNEGGGEGGGKGDDGMEQQGHTFALTARNLTARRGELVGVVGTVGCGKSVSKWV
jgi:ABC-type glutathione transport system ATPase component